MDKHFESTYEHSSEPKNVHTIFQKNVDKNMKLGTKILNYEQTFRVYL